MNEVAAVWVEAGVRVTVLVFGMRLLFGWIRRAVG